MAEIRIKYSLLQQPLLHPNAHRSFSII